MNRLRFVVDAEGKVLSFELVGRSGNADLDRATLEMIRRAQPLPKPPADMLTNGSSKSLRRLCTRWIAEDDLSGRSPRAFASR
jgi:TonB family protein